MSDQEIVLAALRWADARKVRLDAGYHYRRIEDDPTLIGLRHEAYRRRNEAKRMETRAMLWLAKVCAKHRGDRQADDAKTVEGEIRLLDIELDTE